MSKMEVIDLIRNIVSKNMRNRYNYKLFLFGQNIIGQDHSESIDIGIDCDKQLDPELKLKIIDELDAVDQHRNMLLIDFSSINNDLKSRIFKNCEFIN